MPKTKLKHLSSLSPLLLIYDLDLDVKKKSFPKLNAIKWWPFPLAVLYHESAHGPPKRSLPLWAVVPTELFQMASQWHGKYPCLIVFCLVHLTRMKTGEWGLKANQADTFNGWNTARQKSTLHYGDESTGFKSLTNPKPPAAQAESLLKMSPVSNWALSLDCSSAYQHWPWCSPC